MAKITEKQLIETLSSLKNIKPRKEWAVLLKSQILTEVETREIAAQKVSTWQLLSSFFAQRKLTYAFTVALFLIVGVFGFATYTVPGDVLFPVKKISEQSQAALTGQKGVKQTAVTFNSRVNDLALVAKEGRKGNIPSAISEISANASELVKGLKNNPTEDQATIKEIAVSLKTLAAVQGTDFTENKEVKNLYEAVVQSQIADLEKSTLTEDQQKNLIEVKELYDQEKYADALEKILLIGQ